MFVFPERAAKLALALSQVSQAVLRNDHCAVHDQAEVECPEAHQVGAQPDLEHPQCGHQHGDRNDQCRDRGRPDVAEQQQQNQHHQACALHEVGRNGTDRGVDERGAVQDRSHANARRQRAIDLPDLRVDVRRHRPAVAAHQHEDGAKHRLTPVHARGP